MSEENVETGTPQKSSTKSQTAWGKWAGYGALVAITLGAWAWSGDVAFYFSFQRILMAHADEPGSRDMLWAVPDEMGECGESAWEIREEEGNSFRCPPGEVTDVVSKGPQTTFKIDGRPVFVQQFAPGFLRALMKKELEASGSADFEIPSDAEIIEAVITSTPDAFEFGSSTTERTVYAAHMLVRMLLFQPIEIRHSHFEKCQAAVGCAYLMQYDDGEYRILSVDAEGGMAISFGPDSPKEWIQSPGNWLR